MANKGDLKEINRQIDNYNKKLIKLLNTVSCTHIDFYSIINDIEYLKHKKQVILFELASNK